MGKTPVLDDEEMRQLLDSFDVSHIVGLRDRALIALMAYTFGRIGAVVAMKVEDYFPKASRYWVRLHEKGGKYHEMPLHHQADSYLFAYIENAKAQDGLMWEKGDPLFRTALGRTKQLSDRALSRHDAHAMVKRRLRDAGIETNACNHSFRATGITNYLSHGGNLDIAQEMAAHEDPRTIRLYDRRSNKISLTEIEKMRF